MTITLPDPTASETFESRYRTKLDLWDFASSDYERRRYRTILNVLSRPSYALIYEPGCSVGVLTDELSHIAEKVIATDFAPSAVAEARRRCGDRQNVDIQVADVRDFIPAGNPDLIVFSEIGYYFQAREVRRIGSMLAEILARHGEFLAAHWVGHSEDHVLHGDTLHEELRSALPLEWIEGTRHDGFRIDRWQKP